MIKLIEPTIELKDEILSYKQEFIDNNEIIHGGLNLEKYENITDFIKSLKNYKHKETCPKNFVTAHTFLIMNDDHLVGIINTRHGLNDYLFKHGGHIGYSIRKSERQKGYAKEALKLGCEFLFNEIGLEKILVTCDKKNIASKKTIEANNGIFENELQEDERTTLRYWISKL
ncbi:MULTISPECIES: GNAT family N-acetyltransferase [Gemella]|uniref:GNAT family N-acetyltransferase n=1 Tax=Gemella TaxID=1378 RepID=UPI000768144D|nr:MULTISPECIES: GNAT family N-acetyltransferase [Gemella]AME09929.1 acetyltransferase [Gemella sp. oral taxon 928]AXI26068.1 GNAT family acetyltransferase [Gemella sp. ND 6198]